VGFRLIILIFCLLAQGVRAEGLPDLGESAQADLSPQMERRIGEQLMREVRFRDPAYLDDPEVSAYLNDLGARLAAASDDPQQDFTFFAVRDPTLNAFAWPGGYIGVHTGLLLAAQSESELAGVLGHEIAHVTQRHIARLVGKQKQASIMSLAALVVAILAARSNSEISQAAITGAQAAGIQSQLAFTRDFEREADRIGIQTLEGAGFDVRGMATFFERLQRFSRLYENNAPAYLRTHPLTTERIADMESRAELRPYRQVPDSLGFQLVRAKLRAALGTPEEAMTDFETLLRERKFASEAAVRYGLARAALRAKSFALADREIAALRRLVSASPMVDTLAAEARRARGDQAGALEIYRHARKRFAQSRALTYGMIDTQLASGDAQAAREAAAEELRDHPGDPKLWELQARSYAALGKRTAQHRSQAEVYALQGSLPGAIEQLQLAQRAGDGDFFEQSAVDARLRELKTKQAEEAKTKL
jgi:predicted Zn-dependent protease